MFRKQQLVTELPTQNLKSVYLYYLPPNKYSYVSGQTPNKHGKTLLGLYFCASAVKLLMSVN